MKISSRVKANLQSMKASLKDPTTQKKADKKIHRDQEKISTSRRISGEDRIMTLQHDVDELKKQLTHEENVNRALEQALNWPLGGLPRHSLYLPPETLELLAEMADLEEEVVRLEEQVVQFRQDLYKEAIYISSSKKNLESSSDFGEKFPSRDDISNKPTLSKPPIELCTKHRINKQQSKSRKIDRVKTISKRYPIDYMSADKCLDSRRMQFEGTGIDLGEIGIDVGEMGKTIFTIHEKGLLGDDAPNKISESILKCLMFVFPRMCSTSALKVREMVPSLTTCENPWEMDFKDPYEIFYEFENTDIGPYKYLYEVEANIIDKNQTTISVSLAQKLKILLGKLESVSLTSLTHQEKLAFWINIYNSCMMNAILKHGIPETPERVEQLMQEANINVGGYLLNAFSIEHSILRLPYNKKYTSEKAFKNDEFTARSIFGIECAEPLVTFALSCGSWSSPAVKVYTGAEVKNELEDAKRDYLQAAVGISTTKKQLSIPKLLDWYMLDFAKDMETFLDWVCLQLPSEIGNVAMKCLERKMNEPLSDYVQVRPYKFHFRYLLYK